jgi:5-methylcytosine-specific restriction endonuclease McrA
MPCDYSKYPANWKSEIRPAILERAEHKCELCGLQNHLVGYRAKDGTFYTWEFIESQLEQFGIDLFDDLLKHHIGKDGRILKKATKIVLTVAHLDHDISNNDYSNLKALCQRCHLDHDKEQHKATRQINKKQLNLF